MLNFPLFPTVFILWRQRTPHLSHAPAECVRHSSRVGTHISVDSLTNDELVDLFSRAATNDFPSRASNDLLVVRGNALISVNAVSSTMNPLFASLARGASFDRKKNAEALQLFQSRGATLLSARPLVPPSSSLQVLMSLLRPRAWRSWSISARRNR